MLPEPTILPSRVARTGPPATITSERVRRALWRSFLRYGIAADIETAVHAAMNVIGPVLDAKDFEITRLREAAARARSRGRPARMKDQAVADRGSATGTAGASRARPA
jgi:hypothetical protein